MRYTKSMIGKEVAIILEQNRNEPDNAPVATRGTIERVARHIATVRYQVPWHPLTEGYVTYLDGTESYVSDPF